MKYLVFVLTISCFFGEAAEIKWDSEPVYSIDIDCDGQLENVELGFIAKDFIVKVKPSASNTPSSLQFGLGQAVRQDAICSLKPTFQASVAYTEEEHMEIFGQVLNGYKYSSKCSDLVIKGGECDPITIYFNHETNELGWWRL